MKCLRAAVAAEKKKEEYNLDGAVHLQQQTNYNCGSALAKYKPVDMPEYIWLD